MFPGRSKAELSRFFIEQGPRWCHSVNTVVTDGSHSYRGQLFIVIFPEPVMSWTASTPSDGSPKGSLWYAGNCNAANRPV